MCVSFTNHSSLRSDRGVFVHLPVCEFLTNVNILKMIVIGKATKESRQGEIGINHKTARPPEGPLK